MVPLRAGSFQWSGRGQEEERFLTSAGRRFRRSESGRKSRPAPFEMTVWWGPGAERGRSGLVSVQRSNGSTVNPFPREEHFPQFPPESRGARCIFDTEPEEGPSSCHEKAAIFGFAHDEGQRLPDRTGEIRRADGRQTERGTPDRLCG